MKNRIGFLTILLLLTFLLGLVGCGGVDTAQQGANNDATAATPSAAEVKLANDLNAFLENPDPLKITGTKAVTLLIDTEHLYETSIAMDLTPEDLRTTDMGEVRYFVRCFEYV